MKLTVLGTCGSYAGPDDAASGYLIQSESGTTIWMDAGSGTMSNLQKHVSLHDVDAIVLSHEHADHCSDIVDYSVACRWGSPQRNGVPVYATSSCVAANSKQVQQDVFEWHAVSDRDIIAIGDITVRFSMTDHLVDTVGVLATADGRTLAYSADTGDAWSFAAFQSAEINLGLCEATGTEEYEEKWKNIHLSGRQAGKMAAETGVKRLVLTHIWPTMDRAGIQAEAEATFGGPVEIAVVNKTYEV